jgi:hypothetical protein
LLHQPPQQQHKSPNAQPSTLYTCILHGATCLRIRITTLSPASRSKRPNPWQKWIEHSGTRDSRRSQSDSARRRREEASPHPQIHPSLRGQRSTRGRRRSPSPEPAPVSPLGLRPLGPKGTDLVDSREPEAERGAIGVIGLLNERRGFEEIV